MITPSRRFCLSILCGGLLIAFASPRMAAAELPAESEPVGNLGREQCLVFDGIQTFSRAGILRQTRMRLEYYGLSDPAAPLTNYLAWLEGMVRGGYQKAGFVHVAVTARADRPANRIRVTVTEGRRFKCGAVIVKGLSPELTGQLTNRLQEAAALIEASPTAGQPGFAWSWQEGEPVSANPGSLDLLEGGIVSALGELNQHHAEVEVELALDENRQRADLVVHVRNPGEVGRLDRIEVEGLRVNTRADLLTFLQLRPGMPLTGNVTNDVVQRLQASGRFSGHVSRLSELAEKGHYQLDIGVFEFTNAPPLLQELRPEEKAFLKMREWVLDWENRPEDWLFEAWGTHQGRAGRITIVLGQEGLALMFRQAPTNQPLALRYALIAAPEHLGYYSGRQRSKLAGKPTGGKLETYMELAGNPTDDTSRFKFSIGGGFSSSSDGLPYAMRLRLAPVAFVAMAHPREGSCRIEDGKLWVRSDPKAETTYELTADAATGRLIAWRMQMPTNDIQLVVRSEEGAYARALGEIAAESATFTNGLNSQHPWSSSLALLERDVRDTLEKEFPEVLTNTLTGTAGRARIGELFEALKAAENLPWDKLLAPLDLPTDTETVDGAEDFPFVMEGLMAIPETRGDWIRMLGGFVLQMNDDWWPRGSWPWAVIRDATFLAAGQVRWATNDMPRLAESQATGPLGCLIAAQALGRFDARQAKVFASKGATRTTPAALAGDLRLLLRGDEAGQQFLQGTFRQVTSINETDLRTLLKLSGTDLLPLMIEAVASCRMHPNLPPDEALQPVVERHWERTLRPQLLTRFATLWLDGSKAAPESGDAAQAVAVASWLREAAEQGHAPAQMLLGKLYLSGFGVRANPETAAGWMIKAAERGYPHATCELGRLYTQLGGKPNLAKAERWFRSGAEENCRTAEVGLAKLLLWGEGATQAQQEEGLRWLHEAAEEESLEATYLIAVVQEQRMEMEEAVEWYRKAALQGVLEAQSKLGVLLSDGFSVTPDYVEAWVWLKRAGMGGDRIAGAQVRSVERKLTPQQLEAARHRLMEKE